MTEESNPSKPKESYSLFSFANTNQFGTSFGFFDASQKPLPLPPGAEVPLWEFPEAVFIKSQIEPIIISDGQHELALFKGRVSTSDVFGVSDSDLVAGKYEGGLKLWEGSIDLVKTLRSEIVHRRLNVKGKRILELGCGHGLPGIFTGLEGATTIHFQDFNAEVLRFLTIPNVKLNLIKKLTQRQLPRDIVEVDMQSDFRFFAGDWSEVHHVLLDQENEVDSCTEGDAYGGYDIILMAETVYALSSLKNLYELVKKCLRHPQGIVYMAGKKHYFGVGGGTRQFMHLVEEDGKMKSILLAEVADGSSNVREVWKLSYQ